VISVVVPVRDAAALLAETLPGLLATLPEGAELVVVDDGSADGSGEAARRLGARVVRVEPARGPAAARNRGAAETRGDVLVFLDADVGVHADTLDRLLGPLRDPAIAAAFGSYDDAPTARGWISLYKNLSHHFVHQRSNAEASTFWAGCGAVRRTAFESLGGFDEGYARPSIEDVELGYRLRAAGFRIRLVPEAQVTHRKRWTLGSWLASDLKDRAIPWARLVRAGRGLPVDLNFRPRDRAASALVGTGVLALVASGPWPWLLLPACAMLAAAVALDAPLLSFLARRVSLRFAVAAAGLQVLHRAAGLLGFAIGLVARTAACATPGPRPKIEGS
jgi:GT2 family glycosyltransferase